MKTDLKATITGNYSLDVSTPSGRLSTEAYPNKQKEITLKLTNNGNTDLKNVNLTATTPDGWSMSFSQPAVEVIERALPLKYGQTDTRKGCAVR